MAGEYDSDMTLLLHGGTVRNPARGRVQHCLQQSFQFLR
jgi:hypothetical protein